MSISGSATRRLYKELSALQANPPEGIRVQFDDCDVTRGVHGWIEGPQGTPFEGGYFKVHFNFTGSDFPNAPPKCTMVTRCYHPNIRPGTGEICVSTLKKDWKKEFGIAHILITVKCLLIHPNPESALHEEAGKLLLEAYDDYARHARLMTDVHARHRPAEFNITSSSSSIHHQPYTLNSSVLPSSAPIAKLAAVPSSLQTAVVPLQASSLVKGDTIMNDAFTSTSSSSVSMKPISSSSSSGASVASSSTIPKKRTAPSMDVNSSALMNGIVLSSLQQQSRPVEKEKERTGHAVLGASSAGVLSGNAFKIAQPVAGLQAMKKRGLKRL